MLKKTLTSIGVLFVVMIFAYNAMAGETLKLGIINILENDDLLILRDTFVKEMEKKGYNLKVNYFNADSIHYPETFVARANDAVSQMKKEGVDMFLALGMYARVVDALGDTPTIDPSHVPSSMTQDFYKKKNGKYYCHKNSTGTMLTYPFDAVVGFAKTILPQAKTIGYVYNPASPQSRPLEELASLAKQAGLNVIPCPFSDYKTGMEAVEKAINETDVAFGTNDIYIAGFHESGIKLSVEKKFPLVVGIVPLVNVGAVAAMQLDWVRAAQICAEKADMVLKGKKANEIPIDISDKHQIGLNMKVAAGMGLEIPYEWIENATAVVE